MSSNRGQNLRPANATQTELKTYRDIAPETVSDQALIDLIRKHGENDEAIKQAIQTLWEEEPEEEWKAAGGKKLKKKEEPKISERGGGRGRGRSAPPYRDGRGGGRGSGGPGGRSTSVNTHAGRAASKPADGSKPEAHSVSLTNVDTASVHKDPTTSAKPLDNDGPSVTASWNSTDDVGEVAPAVPAGSAVWGSKMSLAQKLKAAESKVFKPAAPPKQSQEPTSPRSDKPPKAPRAKKERKPEPADPLPFSDSADTAVTQAVEQRLSLDSPATTVEAPCSPEVPDSNVSEVPLVPTPTSPERPATSSAACVGSPIVKMGKWGESVVDDEVGSFQFGSFGFGGDESAPSSPARVTAGISTVVPVEPALPTWGGAPGLAKTVASSEIGAVAWPNSSPKDTDTSKSVYSALDSFDQTQAQQQPTLEPSKKPPSLPSHKGLFSSQQQSGAPPGLGGINSHAVPTSSTAKGNKRTAPGQSRKGSNHGGNSTNSSKPQDSQFSQLDVPPGIQQSSGKAGPVGGGLPGYGLGFEGGGNSFMQPPPSFDTPMSTSSASGATASTPAVAPPAASTSTNTSSTTPSTSSQTGPAQGGSAGMQHHQQGGYAAPPGMPQFHHNPYFGNPYFPPAYVFQSQQAQNYYGRGGQGMYQPGGGHYGGDPYAAGQNMGRYGDMYGHAGQFDSYGQQIHHQGGGKGGNKAANAPGGNNTQQGSGNASTANGGMQQQPHQQDSHAGYGNAYGYGRGDQGGAWPYGPGGWSTMMPFPQHGTVGAGGYSPMPPQGHHGNGPYGTLYSGRGAQSSTGSGDSNTGPSTSGTPATAGAGTTTTW